MKGLLAALALLLAAGSADADFDELARARSLLWAEGELRLEVRKGLDTATPLTPATRFQAERRIAEALPYLYIEAVQDVLVDSHDSVGDRLAGSGALYRALSELAAAGSLRESAAFAKDLHAVVVVYRFPFFGEHGLAAPFVLHERPFPIPRILGYTPARTFTGLVILAQGEFPSHGKDLAERVRPALLPRLYDEDMNPVLFPEMCDPQALRKWGVAGYAWSGEEAALQARRDRIGDLPLRTRARGVFGRNATDILLSGETARQLLSRPQNRELLREGKILIILDPPERSP
jgi:hypothetical protein